MGERKYQVQYGSEDFEIWLDLNTMWLCSSVHRRFQRALQNRLWMSISFVTVMKFVLIPHFHVEGILSVHWSWIIFIFFAFGLKYNMMNMFMAQGTLGWLRVVFSWVDRLYWWARRFQTSLISFLYNVNKDSSLSIETDTMSLLEILASDPLFEIFWIVWGLNWQDTGGLFSFFIYFYF